jgi:hypothetical protein
MKGDQMYCVKCGVSLTDGVECCPLCGTPVWNPTEDCGEKAYPCRYPDKSYGERVAGVALVTVIMAALCLSCLIFCLSTFHAAAWSAYVMLGAALFYIVAILPSWFRNPHPLIFVPADFVAACGYLLYICLSTGGHWFMSFAFPVVMLVCLLTTAAIALVKYVRKGRLIITGGLLLAIGGSSVLLEFFQHITFGSRMFAWSLYSVTAFGIFGVFLIVAGLVKPMREHLERKFFL